MVLGQNAAFEHGMSTMLKMEMWRAHPCSRLIFAEYKGFITPVYGGGCAAGYFLNRYMNPNINKYFGQFGAAVPNNAYGLFLKWCNLSGAAPSETEK